MQRKLFWIVLPGLAFLFRDRLLEMVHWHQEAVSVPAILVALIGGVIGYFAAYALVTGMQLQSAWHVGRLIVLGSILADGLGHWVVDFPGFDEFWGGCIAGVLEAAILYGALCGAKEVWTGKQH